MAEVSLGWMARVRREIAGIGTAWHDSATRRGTLATTLVLCGTFGYGMLPPDNVWRGVPGIGWMQTSAPGRILSVVLLLYGVILTNARAMGEFGAVSVVSGHIRGKTNTIPLHVEILYNEYQFAAAFAVASLLTLVALATLGGQALLERRLRARP